MNIKTLEKIEKGSLAVFLVCMILCATLFLMFIWSGIVNDQNMRFVISAFVVGLASFLIWLPAISYRFFKAYART